MEKSTGKRPDGLIAPKFDQSYRYLFDWAVGLIGENRLTFAEIKAWSDLMGETLAPWEVKALRTIDLIYHKVKSERTQH